MDQPESAKSVDGTKAVVTDEVRPVKPDTTGPRKHSPDAISHSDRPVSVGLSHPERLPGLLAFGAILFGISAFAFTGWIYAEGQREILRLSTELAQLRVSLDLYMRNGTGNDADLTEVNERLAALEQSARGGDVPMPQSAPAASNAEADAAAGADADCLPAGMRLLVAAGDNYPICDQSASVSVSFVDNGYITLVDGTSVASGGSTPLPGSACSIAVTSGGDEGLTGYAEIRVSC